MAQEKLKASALGALETVLPWALMAAGVFMLLKFLEKVGPAAGSAAGGAVGGALGGLFGGAAKALGEGLGIAPTEGTAIPSEAGVNLPLIGGGPGPSSPTGSILKPPNNGEAIRPLFSGSYGVEVNVTAGSDAPVMLEYEVTEYPRLAGSKTVSRKVQAVKLKTGRNVFSWQMPYAVDLILSGGIADAVATLKVDGRQVASAAYRIQ